jgi:uncharacterized membrane protein
MGRLESFNITREQNMKIGFSEIGLVYGITLIVFFAIDLIWIGLVAKNFYSATIGGLLRDQVNWPAAILFYLIYIGGISLFVLFPALESGSSVLRVAVMGGLLGLFAYATFDLTALALLKNWSVTVTVVDMIWGTLLTGSTAAASFWIIQHVLKPAWLTG